MSSSNESIQKTVTVALLLCLVCSVVVSASAVMLRPAQAVNEQANMQMNILQAAGLYDPQQTVQEQFELVSTRLVDLKTGEFVEGMDADDYDQRKAAKDPSMNRVLSGEEDIALIKRQAKVAKIYLIESGGQTSRRSFFRFMVTVYGQRYTDSWRLRATEIQWPVWVSMSTRKRQAWAARLIIQIGKRSGPESRSMTVMQLHYVW